jgi:predicted HicB family RNase H-like nuclease
VRASADKTFIHLRVDRKLKERIRLYARRNHTSLSALVTRFFTTLLRVEDEKKAPKDAEQI